MDTSRPSAPELTRATLPAFLFPFLTSFPPALLIGKEDLMLASVTTISPPSAIGALLVAWEGARFEHWLPRATRLERFAIVAPLAGAAALAILFAVQLLFDTPLFAGAALAFGIGSGATAARPRAHELRKREARR